MGTTQSDFLSLRGSVIDYYEIAFSIPKPLFHRINLLESQKSITLPNRIPVESPPFLTTKAQRYDCWVEIPYS